MFRALNDSRLVLIKGFTQWKPTVVNVPLYCPKNTITRASLGSIFTKPHITHIIHTINATPKPTNKPPLASLSTCAKPYMALAMPHNSNASVRLSIAKPFTTVPLKANSFFSIVVLF